MKQSKPAHPSQKRTFSFKETTKDTNFYSTVGKRWYKVFQDEVTEFPDLPRDQVEKLRHEAQNLLEQESAIYNSKMSKNPAPDYNWIRTIMNKGTVTDRVAAHIIAIQDSPVYTFSLIRNLVSMVKVSKKKECIMVSETLTELFLNDLLPPDRKLRPFEKQPLALLDTLSSGNHMTRKSRLIYWYYEDQLKDVYHTFVMALNAATQDSVERNKEKAITSMYKLLAGNPEQEALLLRNLVNKLGDPSQKVASKVIYSLIQLLQVHPNMKFVVMEETEKLLFRPNMSHKAQYYGICFLSQFLLSNDEAELARNLINIYFSFFKACVKKGEVDSRLMTTLLTGVNRAYPYAKQEMEKMLEHIDTMYRVVHHANFTVSLHTLSLLFQVADFANSVSDRFYSALYKKLLDPELATSKNQALFVSLLFKALKKDDDVHRIRIFFKRLFQICSYMPVPLVCGILYMTSQLTHKRENLLALSMKSSNIVDDNDLDEEHYEDIKLENSEDAVGLQEEISGKEETEECVEEKVPVPTWYHCENAGDKKRRNLAVYDPYHRNPSFAGGENCVYTELLTLSQHYHPTVTLFVNKILRGEVIRYSGDPLQDFTLNRFLDRFVFKNPKKKLKEEASKNSKFSRKKMYVPSGIRSLPVDSASYLNESEARIPVDELFMYRYLRKKMEGKVKVKTEDTGESDASSVASEEFNEMLESIMEKGNQLDFAEDLARSANSKKNDKELHVGEESSDEEEDKEQEEEEEEEDEEPTGDQDDSPGEYDSDEEEFDMIDDDDDDDAEDIVFDDSESDMETEAAKEKNTKRKRKYKDNNNVFVSAEEFSEMLDNIGASGLKMSGSSAMSNKDNAGEKQLKWEAARDLWISRGDHSKRKQKGKKRWHSQKNNEQKAKRRRKK
ncbi:CCAAT/enhancer-binding protein zeta [Periplaneta americana]|uniref:CCAAT/enhancer-binding protein zeta n=1 Tax=Periplaneta americana TaxID=6978 RepID=UPI0037E911AD